MPDLKLQLAALLLRVFTGILFFFQGYDKLFRLKMPAVIDTFMGDAQRHHVPRFAVASLSWYTSLAELCGGLMLIAGIYSNAALCALGLDLLLVCFAFSYLEPMWDMKHLFPRLILVALLLMLPTTDHSWGAGFFIHSR